ncbi:hypothetical protein Smp_022460 [Schistosoma mansoni]|uniref:hypothetical protein n=1 Tax=Schistosoma mansoni TaxID=6183 RepID=UPI0001A63E76|nr:hypothetical protein Smp_022460 [Schistosoma mansoni]|eukprot:XP_018653868.1 hypothetical protein Smp_022460 [Schistosoma mansoni]
MGKGFAVHWWQPLIAGNVMGSKIVTNVRVYINNCKAVITHSALRFMYRDYIERDFKEERKSQLLMTLFWAWITYFCINHPEELIGHEKLPDPKTFTDNELGVL